MEQTTRRTFLGRVGAGALAGAIGVGAVRELGLLADARAEGDDRLHFGKLEPLVDRMQSTEADALMPVLKAELDAGTSLQTLVTAATLANVRTFGGHDYVGYHCFFAMVPALEMSKRLPAARAAIPVFKVLHRNATRIQQKGGRSNERLKPLRLESENDPAEAAPAEALLEDSRGADVDAAERRLAVLMSGEPKAGYLALQPVTRDNIDVHQVVLTFRSWDMLTLVGMERADVMLRQSLRQCMDRERGRQRRGRTAPSIRALLPKLIDEHGLHGKPAASRSLSDKELEAVADFVFRKDRDASAAHVAALLAEGVSCEDVGEALSLASARLLLHDPGKKRAETGKPIGSVHGASIGLHAADSAHAWRGIGQATDAGVANASLVTGAWHTAGQSGGMDGDAPHHASARKDAAAVKPEELLGAIEEALRGRDQPAAAALAERYGEAGGDPKRLIDVLIEPAIAHDGALHHEKYFLTALEEFARSRAAHRWVHLTALTRVMASGYGFEAPGLAEARKLFGA